MCIMAIDALIVSRDPDVINVFRNVMEDSGIHIDESVGAGDSLRRLAKHKYEAIVVDCDGVPDGADVIEAQRKGKSNKNSITIAVVGTDAEIRKTVTQQGATFVLQKPISTETVLRCMKASHGLILQEKRRYLRHAVDTYAHLQVGNQELRVDVTDISQGGCAISVPLKDQLTGEGTIRLMLPEIKEMVEGKSEVMWWRPTGQAGVRFVRLTNNSQICLMEWLNARADAAGLSREFKMAKRRGA